MLKYILLDLDGTLLDTTELILESYRYTFRTYLGHAVPDEEVLSGFGTPLYQQLGRFVSEGIEEMMATYRTFNLAHHDRMVSVFPGVRETLSELADRGIKMAIVTSKTRYASQVGLDLFGLSPFISFMVCVEDTERHKPDSQPVLKALDLLGASPEEALFVGDSPHDMTAGHAAGVKTAAALWGPFAKDVVLASSPDFTLNSFPDLLPILDKIQAES